MTSALSFQPFLYAVSVRSDGLSASMRMFGGHCQRALRPIRKLLMLRIFHVQLDFDELALKFIEVTLAGVSHVVLVYVFNSVVVDSLYLLTVETECLCTDLSAWFIAQMKNAL